MTPARAYYNEIDPYAAQWLRNLIAAGHIAPGDVDERSIVDVRPDDLRGYTQCHFFAGIGGWSLALRLAGWPDSKPVWTGSCPCQSFSNAGQRKGFDDERHLWPVWFRLIRECKPTIVFGEQVASASVVGRAGRTDMHPLWGKQANLLVLKDRIERQVQEHMQGLPERSGARMAHREQVEHEGAGEQIAFRGEGAISGERTGIRSDSGLGPISARRGYLPSDRLAIRPDDESRMEHTVSRPHRPAQRIHEGQYPNGPVLSQRSLRGLGGGKTEGDRARYLADAYTQIERAIQENRRAIESSDGASWLDTVQYDLEGEGYACGAAVLGAHSVGAPHIRQRLWFTAQRLADAAFGSQRELDGQSRSDVRQQEPVGGRGVLGRLADGICTGLEGRDQGEVGHERQAVERGCGVGGMADAGRGCDERQGYELGSQAQGVRGEAREQRLRADDWNGCATGRPDPLDGFWQGADWLGCRDGKWRPVVASHVGVLDGLPDSLVRGGDSGIRDDAEERAQVDGQARETDAGTQMQGVRRIDPATCQERQDRRIGVLCEEGLLRPGVHGAGDAEGNLPEPQPQPIQSGGDSKASVRSVRENGQAARSPHRRGPYEQRPIELEDVVPGLSSSLALAELHGRRRDAEALQALCAAICKSGSVQFAPEQAAEIWRSLGREDQDRIRLDFGHIWVARSFSPLSRSEPGRVMRLRGYGNAIVPQVAAEFIMATMP